jgi:hypothetical protein
MNPATDFSTASQADPGYHAGARDLATDDAERAARVIVLRELLAQKFPVCELKPSGILPTGLASFDRAEGGLRRGALTELAGSLSAGGLFLEAMLAVLRRERCFGALIDGGRSFDPQGCPPAALRRLLWVCCAQAEQAVKATDLLLRDGNLPLLLLDLQPLPLRNLRRIPASTWHRFQRLIEPTGTVLVVLTPQPIVEGAAVRIAIRNRWPLSSLRRRRAALLAEIQAQIFARRNFAELETTARLSA